MNSSDDKTRRGGPVARSASWITLLLGLLGGAGIVSRGTAAEVRDDYGVVVKLSPYEVTANSVEFEDWIKVRSPHFVIYTDARLKETTAVLRQLEMLRVAVQHFLRRNAQVRDRHIIVLPTAGSDWRKIASKGGVEWTVALSTPASHLEDLVLAQYDWQDRGLNLVWNATAEITADSGNLPMTFWFHIGLGFFFETAVIEQDAVRVGWENARSLATKFDGWLPWQRFFEVKSSSPEFTQRRSVDKYTGQCAALMQFHLANQDPIWKRRLLVWNALLASDRQPDEALFRQVFELDYAGLQKVLASYMEGGKYMVWSLPFPEDLDVPVEQVNLSVSEIRELFVLSQILNQRIPASETSLDALLARGLKTPELEALLAEACLKWEREDAALEQLRAIIAAGTSNPAVYATAAGLRMKHIVSDEITIHSRLPADAAAEIREWCERALAIEPRHQVANEVLAWTAAIGAEVTAESVREIGAICRVLDGNGQTDEAIAALAVARWRAGQIASAKIACETLLLSWFCRDDPREIATALWKEIDPTTPPPDLPTLTPAADDAPASPAEEPQDDS